MAYGAHHSPTPPPRRSPVPLPRPDPGLARDCDHCLGWGTVVTRDGNHELCDTCQSDTDGGAYPPGPY
ncbi:hypothetical protein [Streptomyces sp. SID10815]|uniref:Small CPxCG-related zinc finger protein n=1 Tax=Streptomyces similanensis TaxID=1274988 RepID=A0ABP9KMJ5_9ACTN|nr:hypothetical protein [Streptomyces sp. SID10815]NEA51851.1 hypothetical protein [Streptomyces sp. SID10815]QKW26099.1 hypothetical protein HUT11_08310 [Streptomyces seoulensis]